MNDQTFAPIPVGKVAPKPAGLIPADFLEPARVQPCYEGADDVSDWAQQTYRPAKPADSDDVFSQDEDAEEVRELLAQRPTQPTPNGKWVGIAVDACGALMELQRLIGELDFFSAGDTGLGRLTQAAERANAVLQRAGYRNGDAA